MQAPKRILILEDETLIGMMLQDYMEIIGLEVVAVTETVASAMEVLETIPFDAAILDVNLAHGERCDAFAAALSDRGIPFILSSGDGGTGGEWADRPRLPKPYMLSDVERVFAAL